MSSLSAGDLLPDFDGSAGAITLIAFLATFAAFKLVSFTKRISSPPPNEDLKAIEREVKLRGLTLETTEKRAFGGRWRYVGPRAPIPIQSGRPYDALCRGGDGAEIRLRLVLDGTDQRGDPIVYQFQDGAWEKVSRLRSALDAVC